MIRKATSRDIPRIAAIFDQLLTEEELGHSTTGWLRGIYPTEDVAVAGVQACDMFVVEEDGEVVAAARINQFWSFIHWWYPRMHRERDAPGRSWSSMNRRHGTCAVRCCASTPIYAMSVPGPCTGNMVTGNPVLWTVISTGSPMSRWSVWKRKSYNNTLK